MDLELSDEQVWLEESINTLLDRQWPPAETAWQAGEAERTRLWGSLVEFGVLSGAGTATSARSSSASPLGRWAVTLRPPRCLAASPFAMRWRRLRRSSRRLRGRSGWRPPRSRSRCSSREAAGRRRARAQRWRSNRLTGLKAAVEHAADADVSRGRGSSSTASLAWLSFVADRRAVELTPQSSFDADRTAEPGDLRRRRRRGGSSTTSSARRSSTAWSPSGGSSPPPSRSARRAQSSSRRAATPPSAGSSVERSDRTRPFATSWRTSM